MQQTLSSLFSSRENPLEQILETLARSDAAKFRKLFLRVRQAYPKQATRVCVRQLASFGLDPATREMSLWLAESGAYINLLFDPDFLPLEAARRALDTMRESDSRFRVRLSRALQNASEAACLIRALGLLENSDDCGAFCLRLCTLTWHPDNRIRSKAVLALCRVRPNGPVIERQMESEDARVRANAVEALWGSDTGSAGRLFRQALLDRHHRVVVNGVLGLYHRNDESFYNRMLELAQHEGPSFRLALAWALGQIRDARAVHMLAKLERDSSAEVRHKAAASLALISEARGAKANASAYARSYGLRTTSAC